MSTGKRHTRTRIASEDSAGLLELLEQYFRSEHPVTGSTSKASIHLPFGICTMSAVDNELQVDIELNDGVAIENAEKVIGRQLERLNPDRGVSAHWERYVGESEKTR